MMACDAMESEVLWDGTISSGKCTVDKAVSRARAKLKHQGISAARKMSTDRNGFEWDVRTNRRELGCQY